MAYFHCLIGGGSSGGGYELTVTCDAAFAGTTITCTDGVTTLTQTCPSAPPYEVVFAIPNGGDWTISGVISGSTVSTGISIPTSAELAALIQKTVTIHSAKEDTISYIDIDGSTQTITFASGETSKQVQIAIEASGSSFTFTSSVAKDPTNLSNDYSKTVTITDSTTDVYVMPDNTLYWWGYRSSDLQTWDSSNGWSTTYSGMVINTATFSTFYVDLASTSNGVKFVGLKTIKDIGTKLHGIYKGITLGNNSYGGLRINTTKVIGSSGFEQQTWTSANMEHSQITTTMAGYIGAGTSAGRNSQLYALWYE